MVYAHVLVSTGDKDAAFLIYLRLISSFQPSAAFRIDIEAALTSIAEIVRDGGTGGLKLSQLAHRHRLVGFWVSNSKCMAWPSPANGDNTPVRNARSVHLIGGNASDHRALSHCLNWSVFA